jgi:hypothetical protein
VETPSSLDGFLHDFRRAFLVAKLPMLGHVAVGAQGHQVREGVVALLASLDLVMHVKILQGPALLTPPAVSLQHQPLQLLPPPDPLRLP